MDEIEKTFFKIDKSIKENTKLYISLRTDIEDLDVSINRRIDKIIEQNEIQDKHIKSLHTYLLDIHKSMLIENQIKSMQSRFMFFYMIPITLITTTGILLYLYKGPNIKAYTFAYIGILILFVIVVIVDILTHSPQLKQGDSIPLGTQTCGPD